MQILCSMKSWWDIYKVNMKKIWEMDDSLRIHLSLPSEWSTITKLSMTIEPQHQIYQVVSIHRLWLTDSNHEEFGIDLFLYICIGFLWMIVFLTVWHSGWTFFWRCYVSVFRIEFQCGTVVTSFPSILAWMMITKKITLLSTKLQVYYDDIWYLDE